MSLYHEAAAVIQKASSQDSGSIQSIVFGKKDWKSPPKTLYALTSQSVKWSRVLADVIDRSGLLNSEKQLAPTLALVLTYDLLFAKKGIALPQSHGLVTSISRHKARLNAELTKARIRERCSSIELLQAKLNRESNEDETVGSGSASKTRHPRWIRVNRILTTLEEQLATTFADYDKIRYVAELMTTGAADPGNRRIYLDEHIPDLLAVPSTTDLTASKAYKEGKIIFQDKASCFPAYLLQYDAKNGIAVDACAAPGNKTTHLAAIADSQLVESPNNKHSIIACEKDPLRSQTLIKMVGAAGADKLVQVRSKQNFLKLDPNARECTKVTALLLDPSCSGSGIVGRDEGSVKVYLPATFTTSPSTSQSKKRKRGHLDDISTTQPEEQEPVVDPEKLRSRLAALSEFQLRLLQHAMSFPSAIRITYSTCSVHAEENENVVCQALTSEVATERGWKIMLQKDQVDGMRKWHIRGDAVAVQSYFDEHEHSSIIESPTDIANACIRCEKSGDDGTMGFFVAGFVRDLSQQALTSHEVNTTNGDSKAHGDEDWAGFEDG